MNTDNINLFRETYRQALLDIREKYPAEYTWPIEGTDQVCNKMVNAFIEKKAMNDGKAIKLACKRLNIKSTYTAIYEFLGV